MEGVTSEFRNSLWQRSRTRDNSRQATGKQEKRWLVAGGGIEIVWFACNGSRYFAVVAQHRREIVVTFGDTSPLTFATCCTAQRQRARASAAPRSSKRPNLRRCIRPRGSTSPMPVADAKFSSVREIPPRDSVPFGLSSTRVTFPRYHGLFQRAVISLLNSATATLLVGVDRCSCWRKFLS